MELFREISSGDKDPITALTLNGEETALFSGKLTAYNEGMRVASFNSGGARKTEGAPALLTPSPARS